MIELGRSAEAREARRDAQPIPCSQAQQRFWFEEQLHPGNPGLNVTVRWQLEGELPGRILAEAWRRLAARHAGLRTSFTIADGELAGIVQPTVDLSVRTVDLRGNSEGERTVEADRWADVEAHATFNLAVAPLVRVTRVVLTDRRSILLVTAHQVICDGWSVGILAHEMGVICAALCAELEPALPELPLDYSDYAAWERDHALDGAPAAQVALAQQYLRGYTQFELLPDRPRPPSQTSNVNITSLSLDRELMDGLADLARAHGSTFFDGIVAALFALLQRYSNEDDITLGTQVAGRDDEDLEGIVGCFVNTVGLRGNISGDPAFTTLLERTRDTVSATFKLRNVPFGRLIEAVKPERDLSRSALFSVNFTFQRSFIKNATYRDFKLIDLPSHPCGVLYDLNIFMVEWPEGWRVSCEYNTDLFLATTIEGLLKCFGNLLRAVVVDPTQCISAIPVLDAADREALIVQANHTEADYPRDQTLPQLFTAQVTRTPEAVALRWGNVSLTYAALDAASNRLARELMRKGIRNGTRVGILLDRSPKLVVALLAVLKAGAAYVPLDPAYPLERLAYITAGAQLAAVVTCSPFRDRVPSETTCVDIDADRAIIAGQSAHTIAEPPRPDDIAYVIYTSGSTGLPKGVQVGHRALVNVLWALAERPGISIADTLVAVTTISFDIAAVEMFLPLMAGATLVIAAQLDVIDGDTLLDLLRSSGATLLQATPVTWQLLIDAGWNGVPVLKMLCGGEALSRALAEQLLDRGPDLWNLYGPTETTIWSSVMHVERGSDPVRIGPPIANTQFYVLDPHANPVPPGVPGELYIGGDGVALGYLNRPELTQERFVADPFSDVVGARLYRTGDIVRTRDSGTFEFLGRTDHQVKLRGFRIELGEIESALMRQPSVAAAVVTMIADASGDQALCAYVVPKAGTSATTNWPAALRGALATSLPAYMLPAAIVPLDELPRTPNGKIDRRALPAPVATREVSTITSDGAGRTPTEIALAELVAVLIKRTQVGRSDDLFAIGLYSLLAVRLVAQILRTFGVKLPLRTLFENPSVATLAQQIDAAPSPTAFTSAPGPIDVLNAEGSRTPFAFFHNDLRAEGMYCRPLSAAIGPAQPVLVIAPHGTAGLPNLPTIEAMAADYLPRLQALQPSGPYRLGGFCAGGLVAYEVAQQLRARGEVVERLVLLNASAPPRRSVLFGDALLRRIGLDSRLDPLVREKLCWIIANLFDSIGHGPITTWRFVEHRLRALLARFGGTIAPDMNDVEPLEERGGPVETANYFESLVASYTYHPQPYNGELILIWGAEVRQAPADPTMGWGDLAKRVRVVPISGGHLSPIREGVSELGTALDRLLLSSVSC